MSWLQDARYAARSLRKSPGFTLAAAITLALGVGANTAIFSVVNAVMLRPLPYSNSGQLVRIWESNVERGFPTFAVSHPNFLDWRAQAKSFQAMAAMDNIGLTWTSGGEAEVLIGRRVTATFLPTLQVAPILGRNFLDEEDRPGGTTRVVILGHGFWRRAFGGDPGAIGKTMTLNAQPYTIVGGVRGGRHHVYPPPPRPGPAAQPRGSPAGGDRPAGRRRVASASHQRARGHGGTHGPAVSRIEQRLGRAPPQFL